MDDVVNHHHLWDVLGDVLLILGLSGIIIPVLQRARISPVLGYLLCGLLIGPHALGAFADNFTLLSVFSITDMGLILILAELGVVFLLFMIGLELTFGKLWELRRYVLGLGSSQILVTALIIFIIARQFDNSLPTAILIGAAFALSSTAAIMQLLTEWHMISRPIGRLCFSVLLMQDLAVVPILVLVSAFSGGSESNVMTLLFEALITATLVIAAIFALGKVFLRPTLRILSPAQNAEWLLAIALFLVIGSAYLTQYFGLSAALGAFLAGLLIAETEYRHEIEVIIEPVKALLMGIFFMSVGMATDIGAILEYPVLLPVSVLGIFFIKAFAFYPLARFFGTSKQNAAQASILLAQCGEFAFLVIGLALTNGLMPEHNAQFFLLVATVSLLMTPFTTRLAPLIARWFIDDAVTSAIDIPSATQQGDHVIIAGFGRVGQTLAAILEDQKIPYVAIDKDGAHIARLHSEGYPVLVGNACHKELWAKLGIKTARAAVITIDDYTAAKKILTTLKGEWPAIPVVLRVKDTTKLANYYDLGASSVVPEALESTLQLAYTLLVEADIRPDEALAVIDKHRQEILSNEEAVLIPTG